MDPGWFADAGLWGLFLAAFLAATIVPFSSEAILAAAVLGPWNAATLLAVASLGNWLGGLTTYGLGRLGKVDVIVRWLRMDADKARTWEAAIQRRGAWLALLAWVPFIGDPIALALGLFRANAFWCAVLMLIGKVARYAVVIAAMRQLAA